LADYYRSARRLEDAKAILEPMVSDQRTFADAQTRLSEIAYAGGNAAGGHAMLKDVLAAQPKYAPALMVQADWLLHEGQPAEALKSATAAVAADARSTRAHYLVGLIQAALYDTEAAAAAFREVLKLNPNVVAAQVQLSRLELQRGHADEASQLAAAAAKSAPDSPNTRLTMARALIAQRDIPRAETAVAALLKDYPRAAAAHVANGSLLLAKHDVVKARAAFERALALDAKSFIAFNGLVSADVIQKNLSSARARVDERMRAGTPGPDLLLLASRVYIAVGDAKAAEGTLRRLIALAPANATPFSMLAQVYVAQGKLTEAQVEFDKLAARDPKDVASRLMGAFIAHARQDLPEASKRYESVLEIDPNSAAAANNLAWILADAGESLDRALRLAEVATRVSPDTAEYNDTVGWVYLKKQLPSLAVAPFERAVAASPDNPTFTYHLGMANAAAGNTSAARTALTKALAATTPFPAAAQARSLLASLR
jgi:tetratricopeptide (TPR) repeat protein